MFAVLDPAVEAVIDALVAGFVSVKDSGLAAAAAVLPTAMIVFGVFSVVKIGKRIAARFGL